MRINYEEKTFECYFNVELANRSDVYFPLGQVQEGYIGADAVALTRSRWLWRRMGHPFWFTLRHHGLLFREIAEEMEIFLGEEITNIPNIKANVFFQYKRSEYIVSPLATEWPHWDCPYFRYDIYQAQQNLLEHLHRKFQQSVLILYAAPALQDVSQLVDYHCNRQIIAHTNFRPAADLSGHDRNTFKNAGAHSIACSEPVRHEHFDLIRELIERPGFEQSTAKSVEALAQGVREVMSESDFAKPFNKLLNQYGFSELGRHLSLLKAHIVMVALRDLSGIQWMIATST